MAEDTTAASPVKFESRVAVTDGSTPHVMGFRHASLPIHGVQFHPESIATQHGHRMLANFMALAGLEVKPMRPDLLA